MKKNNYLMVALLIMAVSVSVSVSAVAGEQSVAARPQQAIVENSGHEVGSIAPLFTLDAVVKQEFKTIDLAEYRGKWVVLFFYPGDFTYVCPTEIRGFNAALPEFEKINTVVLAASVDSKYSHLAWIKSGVLGDLNYPLLSDFSKKTARMYGVLDEGQSSARRGLFIIDPNGVIQYRVVQNEKVGRSVDETLRVLKALQTDELCPLNWKPGESTIKKP